MIEMEAMERDSLLEKRTEEQVALLKAELKQCRKLLENGQRPESHKEWARKRIIEIEEELERGESKE